MQWDQQRTKELIAGRVLGDLSDEERGELESLESFSDFSSYQRQLTETVARFDLALLGRKGIDPMPQHLRDRIKRSAKLEANVSLQANRQANKVTPRAGSDSPSSSVWTVRELVAWAACAAALLFVTVLWNKSGGQPDGPKPVALPFEREEFMRRSSDALLVEWKPGKQPFSGEVSGDVLWSNSSQKGYLRFYNMPINDPKVEQYQLWIIDPARDDKPIDGGVFNVTSSGEAIVPIDAKLQVVTPKAFAVTIEKPGGVVVSSQERLPLLAVVPE